MITAAPAALRVVGRFVSASRQHLGPARLEGCGDRQFNREYCAGSIDPVGGRDRAAHRFDEATANGEPEAGARPLMIAAFHTMELLEDQ